MTKFRIWRGWRLVVNNHWFAVRGYRQKITGPVRNTFRSVYSGSNLDPLDAQLRTFLA
jgi:hypothetical protein